MAPPNTFYDILKVRRYAQKEEIKEAYRKLALRSHPDKALGNPEATREFQKISEAYETLYDEDRRFLYDQNLRKGNGFSPPMTEYGYTQDANEPPGKSTRGKYSPTSESEDDDERMKDERREAGSQGKHGKEKWDRGSYEYLPPSDESEDETDDKWLMTLQARLENLQRLRKEIETMEANIEERDQEEARIRKSEQRLKDRTVYHTSIWDQITKNQEKKQDSQRAERHHARSANAIRLGQARQELKRREDDYKAYRSIQSRQRREQADRSEAQLKATTEHAAQQEAKQETAREKDVSKRLAREKEERRREYDARQREAERQHERESEKDESSRRQRLLKKIDKRKQETPCRKPRSPYFSDPQQNGKGLQPSLSPGSESVSAASTERTRSRNIPRSRKDQPWFRTGSPTRAYKPNTSRRRDRKEYYTSDSDPDSGSDS